MSVVFVCLTESKIRNYFRYANFFEVFFFLGTKKGAIPLDKPLFAAETKTNLQTSNVYTAAI
jgi:hypothetical protein